MTDYKELIERAKYQRDRDAAEHCPAEIIALQDEVIAGLETLLDRLEAAEKDAERYRWLREQHDEDDGETLWHVRGETGPIDIGRLDKAIDAAMEASK